MEIDILVGDCILAQVRKVVC